MRTLLDSRKYDGVDEADSLSDDLDVIIERMFMIGDVIFVHGYLGLWDGPSRIDTTITTEKGLRRMICAGDEFELDFADDEEDASELQRYSNQWSVETIKGSIVLKQWHHDGCNILMMVPCKKNKMIKIKEGDLPW